MGSILCEHCTGVCCRYVALPIDKPTERRDFDDIRWYLMHAGISVFVEEGDWYIQVAAPCENLLPDNRCAIYETRPAICRGYDAGECDYAGGDYHYELHFNTPAEIEVYAVEKIGKSGRFSKPPAARGDSGQKGAANGRSHAARLRLKVLGRHV